MADTLTVNDLSIDDAVRELAKDGIVTSNPDLEAATRSVTQTAATRGIDNLNVVYFDIDAPGNDLMNYAHEVVDKTGGTVIVRSPGQIAIASDDYPRAVLDQAQLHAMEAGNNYPVGMERIFDSFQSYIVPWTTYSLIAGIVIIAIFIALIAVWWHKTPRTGKAVSEN